MGVCGQQIILVAFNRNGHAGDAGTVLSRGSVLEVLVTGLRSSRLLCWREGGSCLGNGNPVSELFIHTRAQFQSFYFKN